jgi:hypothetical protein
LEAQDYLKSSPVYRKKGDNPYMCAITFYDKFGSPVYTESINNIIYRRLSQKIIPSQLLEASSLIIPDNYDEPLTIVNKDKAIVAKVYWACINYIDRTENFQQLLQNGTTAPIEYGKLLPKNLKTNDILVEIKEGRKQ